MRTSATKKGVVACLAFGLGNQLLQFAAGYTISRRLNLPLDLDATWFDRDPGQTAARNLLLLRIVGENDYRSLVQPSRLQHFKDRSRRLTTLSVKRPFKYGLPIWNEGMGYSEQFEQIDKAVCITGVPNLHSYDGRRSEILSMFARGISRASDISPPDEAYAFVHIRLGDFASNPIVAQKMVQLSVDYYTAAMQRFEERHGQTRWIICSDDPEAAIDRLPRNFLIERSESRSEFDDLHIISQSTGGVIANSTFSLWGGLLAQNNNGHVIAPKVWRADGHKGPVLPENFDCLEY